MISFHGPYVGIFGHEVQSGNTIERIEIPLIQRDYAQGRDTSDVERIRTEFLDVLINAVSGRQSVGLDFVYGDVKDGTLRPLDGQQRLTTLFLLHWCLAIKIGILEPDMAWTKFDYATRPSARLFCERIVKHPAPADTSNLASWISDQSWFQHLWAHDPTIQGMLVMIAAIERRCAHLDPLKAWQRLTDLESPAVWFHVLPIEESGEGDTLYIKMNSRGRPLTKFENFKARFERAIEGTERAKEFSAKIDGPWANLFWPLRDPANKTDTEFERFFLYLTEIMEWRVGLLVSGPLEARVAAILSPANDTDGENLDLLISALDAWVAVGDLEVFFNQLFRRWEEGSPNEGVPLFGWRPNNLFKACVKTYDTNATQRAFGWTETLLLYAIQVHLVNETPEIVRRLRTLRNLTEHSASELRRAAMPQLIACVERFMLAATHKDALDELDTFNSAQIRDEQDKAEFIACNPALVADVFRLEDEPILRGSLVSFALESGAFPSRVSSFQSMMRNASNWHRLTGALLACGDYSRTKGSRFIRFGSCAEMRWWRELFTGGTRESLITTAGPLAKLLDLVSESSGSLSDTLDDISAQWLARQHQFDWRFYLVKYPIMRSGASGIYTGHNGEMGYELCMLDRTQMNSRYRDPFLSAIAQKSGALAELNELVFTGYETEKRWLQLRTSGTRIRCAHEGFVVAAPPDVNAQDILNSVLSRWDIGDDLTLRIDQTNGKDVEDRVAVGAKFLSDLIAAQL